MFVVTLISVNSWAGVKAFLNQTTVFEGDPVQLTIESDQKVSDKPDLSVLNQDFHIQGTSEGTSFSMVNGNTSFTQSWTITLQPKRKGGITIPAIQLGSDYTFPIQLTVADITPEIQAQSREHVTLEASADIGKSLPYVQQQIPYTLKLYTDDSIREGDFFPPVIENAVIERISRDKQYTISRNGKRLSVLERHYVISPEKSGILIIPPAIFKGKQREANNKRNSRRGGVFDGFFDDPFFNSPFGSRGKPITTRSDSIEIAIQTIPAEYQGKNWLPAEDLVIKDSWEARLPSFRVGEPVVRILTLQAKGLAGSQIPEFLVSTPEKMRTYPDKEKTQTKSDGKTVFGLRQQSVSYIPNVAGKMTIPATKVAWWNVVSKKEESFIVPERVITVLPGVDGNQQTNTADSVPTEPELKAATEENAQSSGNSASSKSLKDYIAWIVLGIMLGMLSAYLVYKFYKWKIANKLIADVSKPKKPNISEKQLLNQLQQACNTNDNKSAANLLLKLAEKQWAENPPKNLGILATQVASGSELIKALDKSLYAESSERWNGSLLWDVLKEGLILKDNNTRAGNDGLAANLYPNRE